MKFKDKIEKLSKKSILTIFYFMCITFTSLYICVYTYYKYFLNVVTPIICIDSK